MIQLVFWCAPTRSDLFGWYYFYAYRQFWPGPTWLWDLSFDHICCLPVPLI